MAWEKISPGIFDLDPGIRYVAVNQGGEIVEMEQRLPSHNPVETDRMEELVVNPTVLGLTRRRGVLDLDGIRFVIIRYGLQYQVLFDYLDGHVSVGVESECDAIAIAKRIRNHLGLPA